MIAAWVLYAVVIAALLAGAGLLVEQVADLSGGSRRTGWAAIALLALILAAAVARPAPVPVATIATPAAAREAAIAIGASRLAAPPARDPRATMLDRLRTIPSLVAARLSGWDAILIPAWVAGSALLAMTWLVGAWQLRRRRKSWTPFRADDVDVLLSVNDGPAVVGLVRTAIVLPRWTLRLDPKSRALLIQHEREHLRAGDPWLVHASAIVLTLMPWNLPVWWIHRRLRLAIELDCDARVLANAANEPAVEARYGELLLTVAAHRSDRFFQVAPAFLEHTSSLSRRIAAMCAQPISHPRARAVCAASAAALLLAIVALTPAPRLNAQEPGAPTVVRLVGSATAAPAPTLSRAATRDLLARYFPDVLRGEGPESIVFVRDASGRVTGTLSMQAAERIISFARRESGGATDDVRTEGGYATAEVRRDNVLRGERDLRGETEGWKATEPRTDSMISQQREIEKRLSEAERNSNREEEMKLRQESELLRNELSRSREQRGDARLELTDSIKVLYRGRADAHEPETVRVYRGSAEPVEMTQEQRRIAERVVAADLVIHSAGEVGPAPVRVLWLTLRR